MSMPIPPESPGYSQLPSPPGPSAAVSFARGLWRVAAADVSAGNRPLLLRDGAAAFDAMIAVIDGAHHTLDFECYIFRGHDEVGQRFVRGLLDAAHRGVRVRLLVDWVGGRDTPGRVWKALRAGGVDVRIFSPPGFRAWLGLLPRDHRKLLVADGKVGLTGGIGIGEEWRLGTLGPKRTPWRDTAVQIHGPAAEAMERAFDAMWLRAAGQGPTRREQRRMVRAARNSWIDFSDAPPALVGIVEGEPARFRISRALEVQAAAARERLWIATAYFIPAFGVVESLKGAARDGVDVRVLVPGRNDHPWVNRYAASFYPALLRNGVRIWEWQGEMMHAKSTVMDGVITRIGSTDFNPLGAAINYELDAIIGDRTFGAQAEEMFLADLEQSREVTRKSSRAIRAPVGAPHDATDR
ncbi:MAG: cardiolipin synthase B [Gemmatimonas sp.]|nr:cardiolipin synthase B [Gemmatimonas sp.]